MTITLDTETSAKIVQAERTIYANEVHGMQREKKVLLNGQPWNNAVLLLANIIMAGLFFYVTSLNASSVLPDSIAWAQPLVGGVSAVGAGCLMYGTNAIAYKLPTITDTATKWMMWPAWISMLMISAVTSAFLALLLVNGADSKVDTARMTMEQAGKVAGVETASVITATKQLNAWIENGSDARTLRTEAVERRDAAQTNLTVWREATLREWGQGSEAANRRMNAAHPEHAPLIAAVNRAQADIERAQDDVSKSDAKVEEWTTKLAAAETTQRAALARSSNATVTEISPWDQTMSDMASMMGIFGLKFVDGNQFKATFAVFFSLVLTLAPPFWSYQTGASVAPEVNRQAKRMTNMAEAGKEMRKSGAPGGTGAGGTTGGGVVPGPAKSSSIAHETESMGGMVNLALGVSKGDQTLQCGLSQDDYDRLYRLNYEKVLQILDDAENKLVTHTGEGQIKKKYGGKENVAKMLKHVLVMEGHGEYAADGSVTLFNSGG